MRWLTNFIRPKIQAWSQKSTTSETLWTQCSKCLQMLFQKELEENLCVCRYCQYPMPWKLSQRFQSLFDRSQYEILESPYSSKDPLNFKDKKRYSERLKQARAHTHLQDAALAVQGEIQGIRSVVVGFDFRFIGGSMGISVGETLVKAAQQSLNHRLPLILIPSSGGARMQEGILSLMQMPRSVIALKRVKDAKIPTLTLMTHPVTGGVLASFASLSHIIIAEPDAIIGFTGARVIQQTLREPLPKDFQSSHFQYHNGFIDAIVQRQECPAKIGNFLKFMLSGKSSYEKIFKEKKLTQKSYGGKDF